MGQGHSSNVQVKAISISDVCNSRQARVNKRRIKKKEHRINKAKIISKYTVHVQTFKRVDEHGKHFDE